MIFILLLPVAFLAGFVLGKRPEKRPEKATRKTEKYLDKEFESFLSYDGSE